MSISQAAVATIVDHVTMTMLQMPSADRDDAGAPVAGPSVEAQVQQTVVNNSTLASSSSEGMAALPSSTTLRKSASAPGRQIEVVMLPPSRSSFGTGRLHTPCASTAIRSSRSRTSGERIASMAASN